MFPNLFEATKKYWCQLDELEVAYQQGKIPLEEVDSRVAELMAELASERRAVFTYFRHSFQYWVTTQKETLIGLVILAIATYVWVLNSL
jgi:hypothetical protein